MITKLYPKSPDLDLVNFYKNLELQNYKKALLYITHLKTNHPQKNEFVFLRAYVQLCLRDYKEANKSLINYIETCLNYNLLLSTKPIFIPQ